MKTTQVNDVRKAPAYSVAEAAHYLRMPEETLRSWVVGASIQYLQSRNVRDR